MKDPDSASDAKTAQKEAIAALQGAITKGVQSGTPQPFDPVAFKRSKRKRHIAG